MKVSYEERLAIDFGLRRRCDEGNDVVLSVRAGGNAGQLFCSETFTSVDRSCDNNRLLNDGTQTYTYDFEGNRTKKTVTATGEATEYEWDHRNRLVRVTHLDSVGDPVQTLDYVYDVLDRRIGKTDTPAVGPAYTERYVYDGEHLALKFGSSALANRYLHGPVIDQILADEQVSSLSSPGDVLWPLADHLGTVRDLAEYDSGTGDTVIVNHISYDAYGGSRAETNAAVDHLFGYTGREWDAEADLQYNRARWYDPAVGRWLSEDPIGFEAGDANLSRYVGNAVLMQTDPSGLEGYSGWDPRGWSGEIGSLAGWTAGYVWYMRSNWALDSQVRALNQQHIRNEMERVRAYGNVSIQEYGRTLRFSDTEASAVRGLARLNIEVYGTVAAMSAGMSGGLPRRVLPTRPQQPGVRVYPRNPASAPISTTTPPGTYVYVQDANGVVFVVPNGPHLHPTVLGGGATSAAAGEVTIGTNGIVTEINNMSYTFQHTKETLPGVRAALEASGLQVAPNALQPWEF